jgi:hypothetical protein
METVLDKSDEEEIIEIYKNLAEKSMEYKNSFGAFREEMYHQMSQSPSEINWFQSRELAEMFAKLGKQDLVDFHKANFLKTLITRDEFNWKGECKKSTVWLYNNNSTLPAANDRL